MYLAVLRHLYDVPQRAEGIISRAGTAPTERDSYAYSREQPDR